MKYRFRATEQFWRAFYALSSSQKESVRSVWLIFKENPFDPRLGVHKINFLSAHYRKTIYSVVIESDLRVVFFLEGNVVMTVDVGTHAIYGR
jgi:hypothetical protein